MNAGTAGRKQAMKKPKTIEMILRVDKPYSSAKTISPILPDGTGEFTRIVNRDAPLAEVAAGDTIECLATRKREIVISAGVLEWYED